MPATKKTILLASGVLTVSAFLPWYDNRNSFGVGETYLGIEGPLFLVGALIAVFGAVSFSNIFFPLLGRNFFKLKKKMGATAISLGLQSLFLIVVANSVFYHPSFGTNVSHKGTRFGMMTAFVAIAVMVIAGWITHRKEKAGGYEDIDDFMMNPGANDAIDMEERAVANYPGYEVPTVVSEPSRPAARPVVRASVTPSMAPRPSTMSAPDGVDPLTLDAKTRYKMMRSQSRYSDSAKKNLWGSGQGSAFPKEEKASLERDPNAYSGGSHITDSMKIRMDL